MEREMTKLCELCGVEFIPKTKKVRYCSRQHATKAVAMRPEMKKRRSDISSAMWAEPGRREAQSRAMRQQALYDPKFRAAVHKRMTERNPGSDPYVQEKIRQTRIQNGVTYDHLNGGNGTGPTRAESLLSGELGWPINVIVNSGRGSRALGYPPHYKIDVGNPDLKIGIECDGMSHKLNSRKKQDAKKESFLLQKGWTILRFWNHEIESDLNECVRRVEEVIRAKSTT
jgi:hypothetical protein